MTRFVIVQYVPDPFTGERMNIGVLVYGEDRVAAHFLQDWQRARYFGGVNITFLKDFAAEVTASSAQIPLEELSGPRGLTRERIEKMVTNWANSIQLSEPRGSILSAEELMREASHRFLREPLHKTHGPRTRIQAAAEAARQVRQALRHELGVQYVRFVKRNCEVPGHTEAHPFDIIVGNGHPLWVTHGLSFEGPDSRDRDNEISSLAWSVKDVLLKEPTLPIGIAALEPKEPNDAHKGYRRTRQVFRDLGADVVVEGELDTWMKSHAQAVARSLFEHFDQRVLQSDKHFATALPAATRRE